MRARAPSTVRVFDRDAGGSEMATVDKTYPRSECPPASPYIGDYHHTTHVLEGGCLDRREAVDDRDKPGQGGFLVQAAVIADEDSCDPAYPYIN